MCGIVACLDFSKQTPESTIAHMTDALTHRGPDDSGQFYHESDACTVALGHRRLSILDLSASGQQPKYSTDGRYVIIHNGEVYNFAEIRQELETLGYNFSSQSDTELVLNAYIHWGPSCLDRFIGMFAFLIYDRLEQKVFVARDRAGVKPLFIYQDEDLILFSSELKAFHKHPRFSKQINPEAVGHYFRLGYIPGPHCIFKHCTKLLPGHYMEIDCLKKDISSTCYWSILEHYQKPKLDISEPEAIETIHGILKDACLYRMVSDVPVGVFLSGGYDSSAVASILQNHHSDKIHTFTIGFHEASFNEAPKAKEIAAFLGTYHHEHYLSYDTFESLFWELPQIYDEPFADSSAIPTTLLSRFAKEHVTVALSADGGDEIFGGYNSYVQDHYKYHAVHHLRHLLSPALKNPIAKALGHKLLGENYDFALKLLSPSNRDDLTQIRMSGLSLFSTEEQSLFTMDLPNSKTAFNDLSLFGKHNTLKDQMMGTDFRMYMCDDILCKVDRATMSTSLEGREPLIDHRLAEFMAQVPVDLKFKHGQQKYLLKQIVHHYLPKAMMQGPKKGFSIPVESLLSEHNFAIVDELITAERLVSLPLLNADYVLHEKNLFKQNPSPRRAKRIWLILQFLMWAKHWDIVA